MLFRSDRAPVRRILSERNMRTPPIIIGGEFRKDPPQVLFVEHDQVSIVIAIKVGQLLSATPTFHPDETSSHDLTKPDLQFERAS